jgi:predicted nucleotidyltransferase component of viral defense system
MSISIKPLPLDLIESLQFDFGIEPVFIEKDWYTQHILGVIAKFESDEFQPVFSGGTSLSKGYRLIQRFSEDIDFRMRPLKEKLTRSFRSNYQDRIIEAVLSSSSDLQLVRDVYKRDKSTFLKFQVAYPSQFSSLNALRPYVQVELSFEPPQLETETCTISSLINQFTQQPPEISGMACLNLSETAADKLGALSWRVMSKEPDDKKYDPRIIRHLYDLSYLAPRVIDDPDWLELSYKTVANDLKTRDRDLAERIQDPIELLNQLTEKLGTNKLYARHYQDFVESLAYGQSPSFDEAIKCLNQLTERLQPLQNKSNYIPQQTVTTAPIELREDLVNSSLSGQSLEPVEIMVEKRQKGVTLRQLVNLKDFYMNSTQGQAQTQSKDPLEKINRYKQELLQDGKATTGNQELMMRDAFFHDFRSEAVKLSREDQANLPAADEFAAQQTLSDNSEAKTQKRNRGR